MVWLTYILVFVALTLIVFLMQSTLSRLMLEHIEKKDDVESIELSKLVKPERLVQLRILSASILLTLAIVALMLGDVYNVYILVPVVAVAGMLGYWIPKVFYLHKLRSRRRAFEDALLDFTISLVNGLKSGLAFGQSLEATTRHSRGVIQQEFQQVLMEARLGSTMAEALERLADRVPCEDVDLLVTTVKLTMKTGGSLVEVLVEMVETMRQRKAFSDKLRSMTAQGRFQAIAISLAPLVGFLLLSAVHWELMKPLVTTGLGWLSVAAIVILVSLGYFVINKIITIEP